MTLTDFLRTFFSLDEMICGRAIKPKNSKVNLPAVKFEFSCLDLADPLWQKYLCELNQERGMYFVVNAGGHSDAEIFRFNAVFCEMDDLSFTAQHDKYDNAPIPPSIRVETRKSVHAYWLLDEVISPAEFTLLQKGLIRFFGSDPGIHNTSRLMRLPFFNHIQISDSGAVEKKRVGIYSFKNIRYSFAELAESYPYEFPRPVKEPKFNNYNSNGKLEAARQEVINRIEGTGKFHRHGSFGYTNGVCHNGTHSDTALYVNYQTGYVACFDGCDYTRIASALGVNFK